MDQTEAVVSGGSTSTSLEGNNINLAPQTSVDDYNRLMLQYTQRQMAQFTNGGGNRRNSGQSGNSGQNNPSAGNWARGASGPSPTSTAGSRTPGSRT